MCEKVSNQIIYTLAVNQANFFYDWEIEKIIQENIYKLVLVVTSNAKIKKNHFFIFISDRLD